MYRKYCERCKEVHETTELCNDLKKQLQNDSSLINEAMNFTNLAAQHQLISTQVLDEVAMSINKLADTNLTFEGSKQCARDIQVFQQLNVDAFKNSGVFNDHGLAQKYLQEGGISIENNLKRKLTGTAQEIDWLRDRKGSLTRIFEKAKLVGEETANAPGIDGVVENRFTGLKKGVSVKNSISNKGLGTNVRDVLKAIDKGKISFEYRDLGILGFGSFKLGKLSYVIDKHAPNEYWNYIDAALNVNANPDKLISDLNVSKNIRDKIKKDYKEKIIML